MLGKVRNVIVRNFMENLYVFIHYNFVIYLVQSNGICGITKV